MITPIVCRSGLSAEVRSVSRSEEIQMSAVSVAGQGAGTAAPVVSRLLLHFDVDWASSDDG